MPVTLGPGNLACRKPRPRHATMRYPPIVPRREPVQYAVPAESDRLGQRFQRRDCVHGAVRPVLIVHVAHRRVTRRQTTRRRWPAVKVSDPFRPEHPARGRSPTRIPQPASAPGTEAIRPGQSPRRSRRGGIPAKPPALVISMSPTSALSPRLGPERSSWCGESADSPSITTQHPLDTGRKPPRSGPFPHPDTTRPHRRCPR